MLTEIGRLNPFGSSIAKGAFGKYAVFASSIGGCLPLARKAAPDRRKLLQDRPVAVALQRHLWRDIGKAVRAGKMAIKIIETAVLGIKHDNSFDLGEILRREIIGRRPPEEKVWAAARQRAPTPQNRKRIRRLEIILALGDG